MLEVIEIKNKYHCLLYETVMTNLNRFNIKPLNYTIVNDSRYIERAMKNSFNNSDFIMIISESTQISKEIVTNFLITELVRYDDFLLPYDSKFKKKFIDLEPKNIYNLKNDICGYFFNLPKKLIYVISNDLQDINFIFENYVSQIIKNGNDFNPEIIEEHISPKEIVELLLQKNLSLSITESCTGGLIFHELTNIPGSSKVLKAGIVAYSNEAKNKILNISKNLLEEFGAVSSEVAEAMCKNVSVLLDADIGLSTTGILGPDSIEGKPVGLVYIAVGNPQKILLREYRLNGNRLQNKLQASKFALSLLHEYLLTYE